MRAGRPRSDVPFTSPQPRSSHTRPSSGTRDDRRQPVRREACQPSGAAFRRDRAGERGPRLHRRADDRQDDPAAARRVASGVECLHGVFPGGPAGGLSLCPSAAAAESGHHAGGAASASARPRFAGAAAGRHPCAGIAAGVRAGGMAARRSRRLDRRAFRRAVGERPAAAGLVCARRCQAQSLYPLCRKQSRQHAGAARLSHPDRADADGACAIAGLVVRLSRLLRTGGRGRLRRLAQRRQCGSRHRHHGARCCGPNLARPHPLDRARRSPIEPDAGCHNLYLRRRRLGAVSLGDPARALSPHLHHRLPGDALHRPRARAAVAGGVRGDGRGPLLHQYGQPARCISSSMSAPSSSARSSAT